MATQKLEPKWVPKPGTVIDNRYRLGELVDRGGMGVIIRAEHLHLHRDVAVKLLHPEIAFEPGYRARFLREVGVAGSLEHKNVVSCHDSGETEDGLLYLVMELLEGGSLKAVMREQGRFDLHRAADLALQLLDGLAAAHLRQMVHRDLKPGNLFLVKDLRGNEVLKVLDFGLAKSLISEDVKITKTGAICGTAAYLAPETLLVDEMTPAGDVYACGLIMLEMVIGRQVFGGDVMAQTFLQQLTVAPLIPRRIWDTVYGGVIARALCKHPGHRPANAEEMFQELSAARATLPQVVLSDDELPPTGAGDLTESFLRSLEKRDGPSLNTLHQMPRPAVWDGATVGQQIETVVDAAPLAVAAPVARPDGSSSGIREIELPQFDAPPMELKQLPTAPPPALTAEEVAPTRRNVRGAPSFTMRDVLAVLLVFAVVFVGVQWALETSREPEAPVKARTIPPELMRSGSAAPAEENAEESVPTKPKVVRRRKAPPAPAPRKIIIEEEPKKVDLPAMFDDLNSGF